MRLPCDETRTGRAGYEWLGLYPACVFPPRLTGVEQFTVKDDQVAGAVLVIPGLGLTVFFVARREPLWFEKKKG